MVFSEYSRYTSQLNSMLGFLVFLICLSLSVHVHMCNDPVVEGSPVPGSFHLCSERCQENFWPPVTLDLSTQLERGWIE